MQVGITEEWPRGEVVVDVGRVGGRLLKCLLCFFLVQCAHVLGRGEANRTEKKSCRHDSATNSDSHHNLLRRHNIARRLEATLMRKVAMQLTQINVLCRR